LQKLGFSLAIYPASGFLTVAKALKDVYGQILAKKSTEAAKDAMYPFSDMCELMGFAQVWAFDREHAD
jgi:2-methylisocitrate lyase-like PEP mutase family enzyme